VYSLDVKYLSFTGNLRASHGGEVPVPESKRRSERIAAERGQEEEEGLANIRLEQRQYETRPTITENYKRSAVCTIRLYAVRAIKERI